MVCRLHANKSETNESRNVNVDKKKEKKKLYTTKRLQNYLKTIRDVERGRETLSIEPLKPLNINARRHGI